MGFNIMRRLKRCCWRRVVDDHLHNVVVDVHNSTPASRMVPHCGVLAFGLP